MVAVSISSKGKPKSTKIHVLEELSQDTVNNFVSKEIAERHHQNTWRKAGSFQAHIMP